jgi:hypothetical protein
MIKKDLKIGDTFTDNGLIYRITGIHCLGYYISELVGKAGSGVETLKNETEERPKEEPKETALEDMSYNDLKKLAKEKGVSAKGSKEEVVERLKGV